MPPKRKTNMQEEDPEYRVIRSKNNEAVQISREKFNQEIREAIILERTAENNQLEKSNQEKKARILERTAENNQLKREIRAIKELNKELLKDLVSGTGDEAQVKKQLKCFALF